jgi:hypothetical protein
VANYSVRPVLPGYMAPILNVCSQFDEDCCSVLPPVLTAFLSSNLGGGFSPSYYSLCYACSKMVI